MIDVGIVAVYFDAVGTLLHPRQPVVQTYAEFARRHGCEVDESKFVSDFRDAFARQEQIDAEGAWRTDETRERSRWRAIVGDVLGHANIVGCFDELWAFYGRPEAWTVDPQLDEVAKELRRRGLIVGLASNFDSRLAVLVDEILDLVLLQDRCVISSLIGWRKPAREFFAAIAENAGTTAEHVLYVGDDVRNDIQGATSAGMRAVLYDPLGRANACQRIGSLRDLLTS